MALLELSFQSGESSLSVRSFSVKEQISSPFEVYVVALSPDEDIDLDSIVGHPASFSITGPRGVRRVFSGVCSQMGQTHAEETGLSAYEIAIVPTLWLLSQRRNHRIFQHKSVPEVAQALLAEWGIEPEMRLDAKEFPKHEYRVQYGETDLAFLERLLEEAGIVYYFTADPSSDAPESRLVLSDRPGSNEARPGLPIPFLNNPTEAQGRDYLRAVNLGRSTRPGKLVMRDFDFRRRPDQPFFGETEGQGSVEDRLEQYVYAPGASLIELEGQKSDTPSADDKSVARWDDREAKRRADRWLESRRGDKQVVTFEGNAIDLGPGTVFHVDHPHDALSPSTGLLAVQSVLSGTHDGEWEMSGEAVFAETRYRPPLRTAKPRVEGLQSAVVVGPSGQEIHTDEFGRVRVRFHWDREGSFDDGRTAWIRVSQGWAGGMFGQMLVPRVGQEVLVDFFEGDPDHPIIVGRLFNATEIPPYPLPEYKTRSTWKSLSSPGGEGFNEIMFEDKAGGELVFMQAQKDLQKIVKRNESERTGANRSMVVGANRSMVVGANDATTVGVKSTLGMGTMGDLRILGMGQPEATPLPTKIEAVDKKIVISTGDATITLDGPDILIEVKDALNILAEGEVIIQGGPNVYLNCECPPPRGQAACLQAAARTGAPFVEKAP